MKIIITFNDGSSQITCGGKQLSERMTNKFEKRGNMGSTGVRVDFNPKSIICLAEITSTDTNRIWTAGKLGIHISIDGKDTIFDLLDNPKIEVCGNFE